MTNLEIARAAIRQNSNCVEYCILQLTGGLGLTAEAVAMAKENLDFQRACVEAIFVRLPIAHQEIVRPAKTVFMNRAGVLEEMLGSLTVKRS